MRSIPCINLAENDRQYHGFCICYWAPDISSDIWQICFEVYL